MNPELKPEDFATAFGRALAIDGYARFGCRYHMVNTFSVDFATAYAAARGPKFDVALAFIDGLHTYEGKLSIR